VRLSLGDIGAGGDSPSSSELGCVGYKTGDSTVIASRFGTSQGSRTLADLSVAKKDHGPLN
jgi:hypothetical protein